MSARKWVLGALASTAAWLFLANGAPAQLLKLASKPAAVVDGTPITMTEVEAVVKNLGPTATPLTENQKQQVQAEALECLIENLLFQQFLRKNGPHVEPAEVEKKLAELVESLKRETPSRTLADFCQEVGLNETQLRDRVVAEVQWAAYAKAHLTEEVVKRYYDENKDFFDQISVRASHIEIRIPATAPQEEWQAARSKLESLRQEIQSGKLDFAEAAKKHSQSSSATSGGDIGYFPRKFLVDDAFAKAAFALKVNDVSEVVQTDQGLHLIKVTDRKPGQPSDYNKIKDGVRQLYLDELRMAVVAQQRKVAKIEMNLP
jgi:peptidyl-prolyl cis-trans isomerase C